MGYKSPVYDLVTAYSDLLDGVISVPVYREQAPTNVTSNYVLLRSEGETPDNAKQLFITRPVIIVEIVTFFNASLSAKPAEDIDGEITDLVFPTPNTYGITTLTEHKIINIQIQSTNYVPEDGVYRKISRYEHLINQ